ncbi:MAG TPA: 16S rRNA (cytosine(1402)-N(4))-methyltransferase RsmH [Candidatus Babeliales bacterium]|nr:16S rRNA (cytosine(1402)-N(4))-methyltransferase RsmH [Candidatus Babeliales bacterium]
MKKNSQEVSASVYHKPVLVSQVIEYLNIKPYGIYVDVTFGGGGHTRAILEHEPTCQVIAFDWDQHTLELHQEKFEQEFPGRIRFIWGNFARIDHLLKKNFNITQVDGILADFGTSQYQIKEQPGFSFAKDSYLDMRMSTAHQKVTAAYILNTYSAEKLADIFWRYAQERYSRQIAKEIVERRKKKKFSYTLELAQLIEHIVPSPKFQRKKIHPATRIFQALRIEVNKELENIHGFLVAALRIVRPGGHIVCISFHSLEDRIVKEFISTHKCIVSKGVRPLTKKIVMASHNEISENPSSRSARLRAAQVCLAENTD